MPRAAAVGPGINPCCFEVGSEVAEVFPGSVAETSWGTVSIDLPAVARRDLAGIETWGSGACTRHEEGWFSHRKDGTSKRLAAIGWV